MSTIGYRSNHHNKQDKRIIRTGFLFLLPALLAVSFSTLFPFLFNIILSFFHWDGYKKINWVAGGNYRELFTSNISFLHILGNSVYLAVLTTILTVVSGVVMALVLYNLKQRAGKISTLILFLPAMMPFTIVALLFTFLLNNQMGPINSFLREIGLDSLALAWLSNRRTVIPVMAAVSAWRYAGSTMILCFAALQNIPNDLMEAAQLDGAGYINRLRKIILPLIAPMIKLQVVLTLMGAFKSYDVVRVMTNGGPGIASYTVSMLMLDTGFNYREYGLAASMGCILTAVILISIFVINKLFRSESYEF
ncbi:sugar ABC transporter permease [Diplocloster hominis]|uniref:carbohydrate ABC transporter permease n=1 Tax=Diplocloster hominis TaxID=3079010 RepID=UPI0031B9EA5C